MLVALRRVVLLRDAGVFARAVGGRLLTRHAVYAAEDLHNHC